MHTLGFMGATEVDKYVGRQAHIAQWDRGMSTADLADAVGLSQPTMSRKLRGAVTWSVADMLRVAEILEVPVTALLPQDEGRARRDSNSQPSDPTVQASDDNEYRPWVVTPRTPHRTETDISDLGAGDIWGQMRA